MSDTHEFLILMITMLTLFVTMTGVLIAQIRSLKTDFNNRMDTMDKSLNKRIDELRDDHNHLSARLDTLSYRIDNLNTNVDKLTGAVDIIRDYARPKDAA